MMLHGGADGVFAAQVAGIPIIPLAGLTAVAVFYVRGVRCMRDPSRHRAFVAGWLTLAAALASPLHAAGESFLWIHMVQHVLLMAVAAPLLVWSMPLGTLLRGMPDLLKRAGVRIVKATAQTRHVLTRVPVACVLLMAVLWLWHLPALFNASLSNPSVHALQHSTFLFVSLVYWSSVRLRAQSDTRLIAGIASLFFTTLQMGVLSALFVFSRVPFYDVYVTRITAYTFSAETVSAAAAAAASAAGAMASAAVAAAVADQQLAGVIMWVPGALPFVAVALLFVWRVLHRRAWQPRLITNHPMRNAGMLAIALATIGAMAACSGQGYDEGNTIANGDGRRGRTLVASYGCTACHMVPGVAGGRTTVGPSLAGFRERVYIAGVLTNSPDNLVTWIVDPKKVDSLTAMPNVGVSAKDARDIASYLYTLE